MHGHMGGGGTRFSAVWHVVTIPTTLPRLLKDLVRLGFRLSYAKANDYTEANGSSYTAIKSKENLIPNVAVFTIHPAHVLRPFVLRLFSYKASCQFTIRAL
jgi:hypothetical protein